MVPGEAAAIADRTIAAIQARYGDDAPVARHQVHVGFKLSAAALTGALPLPSELQTLLDSLQ